MVYPYEYSTSFISNLKIQCGFNDVHDVFTFMNNWNQFYEYE